MKRIFGSILLAATFALPVHVQAQNNSNDTVLHCIETHFENEQLAKMGSVFLEPEDEEEGVQTPRAVAEGRAAGLGKIGDAVSNCETMLGAPTSQMEGMVNYFKQLSIVRHIGLSNGIQWNAAMENYAETGVRLLADKEAGEHTRAIIAAGAHANGVPQQANDEDEESAILAYLMAFEELEKIRRTL